MSLIFPKKEILYAPMLGSLGGGSARGFGRGASSGGSGLGWVVGSNTTGSNVVKLFDPETMTILNSFTTGRNKGAANVAIDGSHVYHNYGYEDVGVTKYTRDTNFSTEFYFSSAGNSRGQIALDTNYMYTSNNDSQYFRYDKTTGASTNYNDSGGESYAVAVDDTYAYFGGSVNNGDLRVLSKSSFSSVTSKSLAYFTTISSLVSDDNYIYCSGYNSGFNGHTAYRIRKGDWVHTLGQSYSGSLNNATWASYTNAICVDSTYLYTVGYNSNVITKWNKSTMTADSYVAISTGNGWPMELGSGRGMVTDEDYLYVSGMSNQGWTVIKVNKATLSYVAHMMVPNINKFEFWSGGRHIALERQEGGPMFWYRNSITDWDINKNESQIIV